MSSDHSIEGPNRRLEETRMVTAEALRDRYLALEQATAIKDVLKILNQSKALLNLAKTMQAGQLLRNECAILTLRCQRKLGSLLAKLCVKGQKRRGDKTAGDSSILDAIGIKKCQSARAQFSAVPSEQEINGWIELEIRNNNDITHAGWYRECRRLQSISTAR